VEREVADPEIQVMHTRRLFGCFGSCAESEKPAADDSPKDLERHEPAIAEEKGSLWLQWLAAFSGKYRRGLLRLGVEGDSPIESSVFIYCGVQIIFKAARFNCQTSGYIFYQNFIGFLH
jgi:hypothetical protein